MSDAPPSQIRGSNDDRDVAIVLIGRNEGERLTTALASLTDYEPVIYVDSGSTDGSIGQAKAAGVDVCALDPAGGYSAARARNRGLARLDEIEPDIGYVQMIDGDCELAAGWLPTALAALQADPGLAAICGRRRERDPGRSVYNWLCDVEWAIPAGPAMAFGGDVLLRTDAVRAAGGYRTDMIAGEDPDLSIRLRAAGWRIACIDVDMTIHDAAILHFGQWWRRTARAGHAFAELVTRHPDGRLHDYHRNCRRAMIWGGMVPALAVTLLIETIITRSMLYPIMLGLLALSLLGQIVRVAVREARTRTRRQAVQLSLFLMIGKYAEMAGMARFYWNRLRGRPSGLIEYKKAGEV
ncbi:Glycosyl transferase family 2 [Sphingomonas sp. YR710]|uniref:glycosyltransferase n=1 Tax=Sphingomonas sp. YR710 TaxID=1882773 RepID=UPI000880A2B0|nr:glycosyltransferase [Sphingomonas sp. YR710]SDD44372.1 Glycosyl transferase family 2 [Sphingomonas sp. YR710]